MNRPADPRSVRSTSLAMSLPTIAMSLAVLTAITLAPAPPADARGPAQAPPDTTDHQPRPFGPFGPIAPIAPFPPTTTRDEQLLARVYEPVDISLEAYGWDLDPDAGGCAEAWLDFDDGSPRQPIDCPPDASGVEGAYPPPFSLTARHAYDAPGNYSPTLVIVGRNGIERAVTAVEVAVAVERVAPHPLATALRLYLWKAAVVAIAGVALIVLRGGMLRGLGIVLIAGALAVAGVMNGRDASLRLQPSVEGMVGQTGLDPLRPDDPVAAARITGASPLRSVPRVTVELEYESGEQATYRLPQYEARGAWLSPFFHYDGLGRLRARHAELPGLPMADLERDGIALGSPEALLHGDVNDFGDHPWLAAACIEGGNLVAAPDESAIVMSAPRPDGGRQLLLADLEDERLHALGEAAGAFRWAPDGSALAVLSGTFADPWIELWRKSGTKWEVTFGPKVPAYSHPDIADGRLWALRDGGIWSLSIGDDFRSGEWRLEASVPGDLIEVDLSTPRIVRVSPDGSHVAYRCDRGICIQSLPAGEGSAVTVAAPAASAIVWSPDSSRLAVVSPPSTPRRLRIIGQDGTLAHTVGLALAAEGWPPSEVVGDVVWSRDGGWIMAGTCPYEGRRIIAIDADHGLPFDLSQPRWDAWSSYLPESNTLALWNGRGGLWRVPVLGGVDVAGLGAEGVAAGDRDARQIVTPATTQPSERPCGRPKS